MRATLDIPKKLLAELKAAVPSQSRAEAVRTAVAEFVRQRKRESASVQSIINPTLSIKAAAVRIFFS